MTEIILLGDKELVEALALDGEITKLTKQRWEKNHQKIFCLFMNILNREEDLKEWGIESAFVATRSGLIRWEVYTSNDDGSIYPHTP